MSARDDLYALAVCGDDRTADSCIDAYRAEVRREVLNEAADMVDHAFHNEPFLNYPPDFANYLREAAGRNTGGTPPPAGEPTQPAPQNFVIWSATFPDDDSTFGHYTSRDPAMAHIHQLLADEENTTTEEIQTRVLWRPDNPTGPEGAPSIWECWFIEADRDDYEATGYVVSPLTVASAYEPTPQADRFPYLGAGSGEAR